MTNGVWLVLMALAAAAAPGARAQDEAAKPAQRPTEAQPNRRDETFRIVDAYVVSHLQDSLGLTDEQYVSAVPLVARLQADRRQYFVERSRILRELRRMLRAGGASEQQVGEKLTELKKLEEQGAARIKGRSNALDAALTPLQQAKFRMLELDVEQRIHELMNRLRAPSGRAQREP